MYLIQVLQSQNQNTGLYKSWHFQDKTTCWTEKQKKNDNISQGINHSHIQHLKNKNCNSRGQSNLWSFTPHDSQCNNTQQLLSYWLLTLQIYTHHAHPVDSHSPPLPLYISLPPLTNRQPSRQYTAAKALHRRNNAAQTLNVCQTYRAL